MTEWNVDGSHDDLPNAKANTELPAFEGQPVSLSRAKLTGTTNLDVDHYSKIDDIVRFYVEGRVVGVQHIVDEKTGRMARVHVIKVADAIQLPWDFDTGVFQ